MSPPLVAKVLHSSSWSSARTLTLNDPEPWIRGQLREPFDGQNSTSGGSSETEVKDWQAKPTGSAPSMPVTIVTPVAKWPMTRRSSAGSTSTVTTPAAPAVTPGRVAGDVLRGVVVLDDPAAEAAELDVEAAGRRDVERHHVVVGVPAQRRRQRELPLVQPVQRHADVVELGDLEHEVDDPVVLRPRREGQRVVPLVARQEPQVVPVALAHAGHPAADLEGAAAAEAEQLRVEVVGRLRGATGRDDDVPQALAAGDERRAVRSSAACCAPARRRGRSPAGCRPGPR